MRQALSIALIEYTGALVVISHDRHLLRSVCDELLIVHDGCVDRFTEGLDDYPQWLKDHETEDADLISKWQSDDTREPTKKQKRQEQAELRRKLKPLKDRVRTAERQLAKSQTALANIDAELADESIYADSQRKDELKQLLLDHASVKASIETLEQEWLDATEQLECAQSSD